ncbi:glycosyltransferase family 2 protein [Pseudocnuella soli]|uniref:glycosyltransferase family 2 protein n=1 Tax=Pseudocnuella soli TaxID=2502779 RepID=UPI00104C7D5C|nr:glycosyltransferase family 2 protein [Pseudocnuella soli]
MTEEKILVTIIIPNYNRAHLIGETLSSIQAQAYENWEGIIVDDGSTDQSIDIINSFLLQDLRFSLIKRNRLPNGAPTCRNIGMEHANGDYIMFLDSDDLLSPNCIKERVKVILSNLPYDIYVFPNIRFKGSIENTTTLFYANDMSLSDVAAFLVRPQWCISGSIIDIKFIRKNEIRFEEGLTKWQDWEFHLKILIAGARCLRGSDKPDVFLRQHIDPSRINFFAHRVNPEHSTILRLMHLLHSKLIKAQLFNDEVKEAFYCRCLELTAFLINTKNYRIAQLLVVFMKDVFGKQKIFDIIKIRALISLLNVFSGLPKIKTLGYVLIIRSLNHNKKKMLFHVP